MHEEKKIVEEIVTAEIEERKKMSIFKSFVIGFLTIIGVLIIISSVFVLGIYIITA